MDILAALPGSGSDRADRLIAAFGPLPRIFRASHSSLAEVLPNDRKAARLIAAIGKAMREALRFEALGGPVLANLEALVDYLAFTMSRAVSEEARILFLDLKNRLLREEVLRGSLKEVPLYPREIVRQALEVGANSLILVHNHPSGDPEPSRRDIELTRAIQSAASLFDICVHDHLIMGRSGWTSFRAKGLL